MVTAKTLIVLAVVYCLLIARVSNTVRGLRNVSPEGPCNKGELVFVGFCNLCLCNKEGKPNQLCATSWCPVKKRLPTRSELLNSSTSLPFS
ncbi:Hypothetical protein CINCED_3A014289 [Cinara cedri]|uniref:Pacifastin domain-containing protein n=1 Tax=Cinara cedri TaxID=506608 RepID=A0A5E4N0X2_9HEMI|nr:Hypothetical protein CINCED_3A014289 [Cinara cedri]